MSSVDVSRTATSGSSSPKNKKKSGEPHRIYWQQWIANSNGSSPSDAQHQQEQRLSRRELITSSAAVRLSRSAKAADLTNLLRQTLKLPEPSEQLASAALENNMSIGVTPMMDGAQDCLVLVGTLYSLPRDYVQFEHELLQRTRNFSSDDTVGNATPVNTTDGSMYRSSSGGGDPFHVVRTLGSTESPLVARDQMDHYLKRFLQRAVADDDLVPIAAPLTSSISMDLSTRTIQPLPLPSMPRASTTTTTSSSSLGSTIRTTIAPKLQWYYVPAVVVPEGNVTGNRGTLIPNCVELDGYCTAMEDDNGSENDDDDDDSSSNSSSHVATESTWDCGSRRGEPLSQDDEDTHLLLTKFPWLVNHASSEITSSSTDAARKSDDRAVQQKLARENRLYEELSTSTTTPLQRVGGYLLKRDSRDKNVWRSVHCVLTDDYLWYVSRVYTRRTTTTSEPYRCAKHGRIKLTRALLLEPTADYAPLYRTPYAFEVVSTRGTSHVFRASSKQLQSKWILSLSERIVQSYESSLMEQAELIMADEYLARNRRTTALAVEPLWDAAVRVSNEHFDTGPDGSTVTGNDVREKAPSIGNSIGSVLRWGMEVAEFRDRCRFILSSMPAKTPVVAATTPQRRRFFTSRDPVERQASTSELTSPEPLNYITQEMIRASWDQASALLSRATSLALTFHVRSSLRHDNDDEPAKLSHAVDTLCRHVEYVITGSFRHGKDHCTKAPTTTPPALPPPPPPPPASLLNAVPSASATAAVRQVSTGSSSGDANSHHQEDGPPPADLFDHLLTEMQLLAAAADRRGHREAIETVPTT